VFAGDALRWLENLGIELPIIILGAAPIGIDPFSLSKIQQLGQAEFAMKTHVAD